MYGKIKSIKEVFDLSIEQVNDLYGKNGSCLGVKQMLNTIIGSGETMDGYEVATDKHKFYVLIGNGQCCCESWGYLSSDDDFNKFLNAELKEVNLTDVALNSKKVEESGYYDDCGGIQFVDFVTSNGTLQLAVYNSHNGYYGHGIVIGKDDEILLKEVF